jgi:predicted nicotinamide N-methyase
MSDVSRTFSIPSRSGSLDIVLHEPSLTSDNLGLKTWAASFLLSKRLLKFLIPCLESDKQLRILELGSGTGLVGIAAAAVLKANVHLTDLPDIVPNLVRNVQSNEKVITANGGIASAGQLDWSILYEDPISSDDKYPLLLAADPLYSPEHPKWLVQTVDRWLQRRTESRFIVEFPLRDAYIEERADFASRIHDIGLVIDEEGEDIGFDDWQGKDGDLIEVKCWWGVFKWKGEKLNGPPLPK